MPSVVNFNNTYREIVTFFQNVAIVSKIRPQQFTIRNFLHITFNWKISILFYILVPSSIERSEKMFENLNINYSQDLVTFENLLLKISAVDSFSNPGVFVVSNRLSISLCQHPRFLHRCICENNCSKSWKFLFVWHHFVED